MPGFVHQIPQPDWLTHVKFGRRGLVFVPWTDTGTGRRVYGILKNSGGEVTLSIVVRDLDAGDNPLYVGANFWIGEDNKVLSLTGSGNGNLPTGETYICENGGIVAKFSGVPVGRPRGIRQAALFKGTESEGSVQHYVAVVYDPEIDTNQVGALYGVAVSQAKDAYAWYKISDLVTLNIISHPGVFSPNGRKFIVEGRNRSSEGVVEYSLKFDTSSNRIVVEGRSVLDRKTITTKTNVNVVTTYKDNNPVYGISTYNELRSSSMNGGAYAFIGYTRDNQISVITKTYAESNSYSYSIDDSNAANPPGSTGSASKVETTTTLRNNTHGVVFLGTDLPSTLNTTSVYENLNYYSTWISPPPGEVYGGSSSTTIDQYGINQGASANILLLNSIYPFSFHANYNSTGNSNSTGVNTYEAPGGPCGVRLYDSSASTSGLTSEYSAVATICGQEFETLTFTNPIFPASSCEAHCTSYGIQNEGCPQSFCDPPKADEGDDPVGDCFDIGYGRQSFPLTLTFDQSDSTETTEDYWQATDEAALPINYINENTFLLALTNIAVDINIFYGDGVFVYQKIKRERYSDEQNNPKWRLIEQKATAYTFSASGVANGVDLLALFNDVYQAKIDSESLEFVSLPPYSEDPGADNKFPFTNIGIM